jgi:hypothetical protein
MNNLNIIANLKYIEYEEFQEIKKLGKRDGGG